MSAADKIAEVLNMVREMSHDELVERIRNSRTRSSAEVVEEQKRERQRRAEAAAARLRIPASRPTEGDPS